jgi:pyruvate dehydrogenase E2 component (dihydrolipoamide acetyltransferase)
MAELNMPRLSDTMEEGTIGRWMKQPGDQVERGEIVAEIETDKATMELEAYESGTLQKILVPEGETVAIGEVIALIGDGPVEEAPAAAPQKAEAQPAQATETQPAKPAPSSNGHGAPATSDTGERLKASPVARRLASEYGIDLRQVQGTGPGGRIIKENVEAYRSSGPPAEPAAPQQPAAAPQQPTPAAAPAPRPTAPAPAIAGEVAPMSRMRRAIATAMNASKPGIPHIYVTSEIDMAAAMTLRKQINESGAAPVKISLNDMIIKATARALTKYPSVNSVYATDDAGKPAQLTYPQVNISVAVALEEGLMAPVVIDTDKKSLGTISGEVKDKAGRAREGKIRPEELEGGTFTVSNLGMFDVVEFAAIITATQGGALAVGNIRETPVVRDGKIVIGQMMYITVSVDHRLSDGATAAQFAREIKQLLEAPMGLLV